MFIWNLVYEGLQYGEEAHLFLVCCVLFMTLLHLLGLTLVITHYFRYYQSHGIHLMEG